MKKIVNILLIVLIIGCINKKEQSNSNSESESHNNDRIWISQNNLDDIGLSKPASLKEISNRLTDEKRKRVTSISIYNGENINKLDGIELFPSLENLDIYKSQIKNLNDIQRRNLNIKSLFIESSEMEDISNIVFFDNLVILTLTNSEKVKSFPDITHLNKLRSLSLSNFKKTNFNNFAEKLPLGIQIIRLSDCNIKSLKDIDKLFKKNIKRFDLSGNPIREIDFDMDYGAATYIYMTGCPIGEKYFNWDDSGSEKHQGYVRNVKGVFFDFGPFEDEGWVIDK
jgi:Leucine-rich repeat (LRR) protein